jgi:hypothetical protein
VHLNDLASAESTAYLLQFDSVHGVCSRSAASSVVQQLCTSHATCLMHEHETSMALRAVYKGSVREAVCSGTIIASVSVLPLQQVGLSVVQV